MGSNHKFKDYMNAKVRLNPAHITLIVLLSLCVVAAEIVFMTESLFRTAEASYDAANAASRKYVFEGIDDPEAVSKMLSDIDATHVEWTMKKEDSSMDGIYFIPRDNAEMSVFHTDMNDLCRKGYSYKSFSHVWVDSGASDFYCVINIAGRTVDLSGYYILVRNDSDMFASRAIFNCYEAETVILSDTIMTGTLLAPYAEIKCSDTYLYGQLYGRNISGNITFCNDVAFTGLEKVERALIPVELETRGVRMAAVEALKSVDPMKYTDYKWDSQLVMADLERITSLDLNSLAILTTGDDLLYFENLNAVNLRYSSITSIPDSVLERLKSLDISYAALPLSDLAKCTGLMSLCVSGRDISSTDLSELSGLVYFECSDCGITPDIFRKISAFSDLETLIISDNRELTEADFSGLSNLKNLDISGCALESFDITPLSSRLQYLRISFNNISELDVSPAARLARLEAYGTEKIDISGLRKKGLLLQFLCDQDAVVTDDDPPEENTP